MQNVLFQCVDFNGKENSSFLILLNERITMRKISCLLFALLLLSSGVFAQQDPGYPANEKSFRVGFAGLIAPAWLSSDNQDRIDPDGSKFALGYGIVVDYLFNSRYAISTGLNMVHNGGKYSRFNEDDGDRIYDTNLKLQYLEVPLTVKGRSNQVGYFTYFGQIGLTPAIALRTRYDRKFSDNTVDEIDNEKANDFVRIPNMGLTLAAGVEYAILPETSLFAALYFNNGFLSILEKEERGDDKVAVSYLGLKVGVFF